MAARLRWTRTVQTYCEDRRSHAAQSRGTAAGMLHALIWLPPLICGRHAGPGGTAERCSTVALRQRSLAFACCIMYKLGRDKFNSMEWCNPTNHYVYMQA